MRIAYLRSPKIVAELIPLMRSSGSLTLRSRKLLRSRSVSLGSLDVNAIAMMNEPDVFVI